MIIQFSIENKDGDALCKLLHTSRAVRQRAVAAFDPVELYERQAPPTRGQTSIRISWTLLERLYKAVIHYMLNDFSVRLPADVQSVPRLRHDLLAADGSRVTALSARVKVATYNLPLAIGKLERQRSTTTKIQFREECDETETIWSSEVYRTFKRALDGAGVPRILSPYQRALTAALEAPSTGIDIEVELDFRIKPTSPPDAPRQRYVRTWRFTTADTRPVLEI